MKKYIFIVLIVIVLGGLFFFFRKYSAAPTPAPSGNSATAPAPAPVQPNSVNPPIKPVKAPLKSEGRLVVGITDATVPLDSIQGIQMVINEVKIRNSSTQKWISLSSTARVYNLLALDRAADLAVFSDNNVPRGIYDQVRISIAKVSVLKSDTATAAMLPASTMTINGKIIVINGKDAVVSFDFLSDKSLHITQKGSYLFIPVVRVQIKSQSSVQIMNDVIHSAGGVTDIDSTVGMNEKGVVKTNFILDKNTNLDVIDNIIQIVPTVK